MRLCPVYKKFTGLQCSISLAILKRNCGTSKESSLNLLYWLHPIVLLKFFTVLIMVVYTPTHYPLWRSLCLGLVAALLLWLILPPSAAAMTPKHYTELTFPPLAEIQVPAYQRHQLANGMVVYLLEDHEWPLVRGTLIFRAGSRWDPPDQVGLAEVSGDLIRTGGTQLHRAAEIDQWLEDRAAAIEAGVGKSLGRINFNSLKEHSEAVLSQLAEMLQAPAVEPERFELAIRRRQGIIQRRDDQPNAQAEREFYKLIYGAESPYARTQELETLAKITPEDVQQFYRQYLAPSRCILGLVGDFDASQWEIALKPFWRMAGSAEFTASAPCTDCNG